MRIYIQSTALLFAIGLFLYPVKQAYALIGTSLVLGGGSALINEAADEIDEIIARAEQAGMSLITYADDKAEDRLNQIDEIVDGALSEISGITDDVEKKTLRVLKEATIEIRSLEDKLMEDLSQAIFEVDCRARVWTLEDVKFVLGDVGKYLNTHQIELSPPVKTPPKDKADKKSVNNIFKMICIWCEKEKEENIFDIKTPFVNTYIEIKDYMLSQIDKNITLETPTYSISHAYDFIATFAKKAQCFEAGRTGGTSAEYVKYLIKANNYNNLLTIEVKLAQ